MRKLMWFTVGFAASCAFCVYVLPTAWLIPLLGIGALLSFRIKRYRSMTVTLGMLAGIVWFMLFQGEYLNTVKSYDGASIDVRITASGYSFETSYGVAFDGNIVIDGESCGIRVYLNQKEEIMPGDVVEGRFSFRYTPPGGKEESTHHSGKGIFLLAYQKGLTEHTKGAALTWSHSPAFFAGEIKARIQRVFPNDVAAIVQALLLGDSTNLDYATDTALKISGIRHIIAVSGLHVMLLYAMIRTVTLRKRYLTALASIPILIFFAAMAGFTPSVVRACIMVALMILAELWEQSYDPPTALAFSVLVMLAVNPYVITSVGFQLTVGCVAGIQLFSEPISDWMKKILGEPKGKRFKARLLRWVIGSVSVSLSAMSITVPLCAIYFGTVSLVGVVTNLLTVWAVSWIFYGIVAVCAISFLSIPAAALLAQLVAWPIRVVLWTAEFLASFPLAAVYTRSPYITLWLIFVYILLGIFLLQHKRHPQILFCCVAISLSIALLCSWIEPTLDDVRVTVIDVGQGQSILIQNGEHTFLVDCGGDTDSLAADAAAETLLSMGIYRVDCIIVTHGDRDHAGGIINLLSRVKADRILLGACSSEALFAGIEASTDAEVITVTEDLSMTCETSEITVFAPLFVDESNENSLCVLFDTEKCDILITGDRGSLGETMLLREYHIPKVDVLVAGHHGSKYATTEALLQTAAPEVVMISVSGDNPYGHPAQETLDRLAQYGCRVYRTDIHGTIIYRR